jgi:Flp pilus assembly protein TadG
MRTKCNHLVTSSKGVCDRLCKFGLRDTGSQLAEVGLVMGFVVLPLMMGLFSLGRALNTYETMARATREGARLAVVKSCATCGNAVPAVANVENAVLNTLKAASINTANVSIPTGCSGNLSTKICYQRDITLNSSDSIQELGVVVSFTYPVTLSVPFTSLHGLTINITPHVQMREEN